MRSNSNLESIFFFDHDLSKEGENGIQLMDELAKSRRTFLVTGRAKDETVQRAARERHVQILDKADIGGIRFHVHCAAQMVLIDDSRANRVAWTAQAKRAGRSIATFTSGTEFFRTATSFDQTTPIYVDYFFDGEPRGVDVAEQLIRLGFTSVYLATDYAGARSIAPSGVRGVVTKQFPLFRSADEGKAKVRGALPLRELEGYG